MIRRKHAKVITFEEFLPIHRSKQGNKHIVSCDIEDILCGDYVYLLDSMDMEDFEYDDTSFDIFKEIVFEGKVVGFVSYMVDEDNLGLMESYIMPEYRDKNLLCSEILSQKNLTIINPGIDLVKTLIDCNLAVELSDGIVASNILFNVSSYDLISDINGFSECYSHIYDLNHGSVLLIENQENFNYSEPRRTDMEKYGLNGFINKNYLNKAQKIVSDYDKKYLEIIYKKRKLNIMFV